MSNNATRFLPGETLAENLGIVSAITGVASLAVSIIQLIVS